ncbi:MAG: bifunctional aspartate kinase/diaminopimelate decarboxylase [Acidobacteria bacterium]|nr:bifunctional aspartate kinase/diaminopimelate decarboxylase [Acidobacteriota bacterium]
MPDTAKNWRVLKFGGRSTATPEEWRSMLSVIRSRIEEGISPFVVLAALQTVTRRLNAAIAEAVDGNDVTRLLDDIRAEHVEIAQGLDVPHDEQFLRSEIDAVRRVLARVSERRQVHPRQRAEILATGEELITRLAERVFKAAGLTVESLDARELLRSIEQPEASVARRYLQAECEAAPDQVLQKTLARLDSDVVMTQGFIASNAYGDTVLLGWGGSDTSASYFAAKIEAERVELWKNVPGFFTTDPALVPSARLLRLLDYDEAEELARAGAEVVHPRAIGPLRKTGIPLEIRSIGDPGSEHTVVTSEAVRGAQVKAIATRKGISLIAVQTPRMWHEVGFLARLFDAIAKHDLSVNLVATSETNVTISIDPVHEIDDTAIHRAVEALRLFCRAELIAPCAVVSLIGRGLRSILPELTPALSVMDEQPVHVVSQSATDLDFAFVVDQAHADRIVQRLHASFFDHQPIDEIFGPSWNAITRTEQRAKIEGWWVDRRQELLSVAEDQSPVNVYDEATFRRQVKRLLDMAVFDRIFYATKANWNDDVLRTFHEMGIGFECVSPGEIEHTRRVLPDLDPTRILFTPNFAPRADYEVAFSHGAWVTLDNVHPLESWPEVFEGRKVLLRIDPGRGHGHHKHVRTAGAQSKFGISPEELEKVARRVEELGVEVVGLHAHVGSGVKASDAWIATARTLSDVISTFPGVRIINVGGGLGVVERPGDHPLDLTEMAETLRSFKGEHTNIELWLEPGRFLVAEAGVLLTRVTQLKRKGSVRYVGVDTGFNSLLRPALYGAHHEIVNLTRWNEPAQIVAEVVGPICETGDVLGHGRALPESTEGDVMLIATAGAYGRVMGSEYNRRPPAEELFLKER